MIVCFTGHRPNKLGGYEVPNPIYNSCYEALTKALREIKPKKAITGMALGVDTWAALVCLDLEIPYIAAVPFEGQEGVWPQKSKWQYQSLLSTAEKVHYVCDPGYSPKKMQIRNEWMVDNADVVIAVWNGSNGGTANCVKYAMKQNKRIFRINPADNFNSDWFSSE